MWFAGRGKLLIERLEVEVWELTIAIFVLFRSQLEYSQCKERLTNRENASLNSETCSSVRESAWETCCQQGLVYVPVPHIGTQEQI